MKNELLLTMCISITWLFTHAQVVVQNTGRIHVTGASDILYVGGSLTNASSATLTNNGQLYVTQNLTNSEAMTTGTGTLYLAGTAQQVVSGMQPFRTFNLVTNNASGFLLNANLHVSGAHTFTNGVIATSVTPNYLVYEAGSSYSGSGDSRHVNGWVKKLGSTNFAFPVGNGLVERPVNLVGLSATSEFNVRHNMATQNTTSRQSPISNVDGSEYWTINRVSGGTVQILMNWNNAKVPFPQYVLPDIRAVYYNGSQWTSQGGAASGNVSTTGTITSNTMSVFGNFTFGSLSATLPVHFLGVWGQASGYFNLINWKTGEEINIDHFEIERSRDGIAFTRIGQQVPNNTAGVHQYQFTDDVKDAAGIFWYRIKNIDIDGQHKYSAIIRISHVPESTPIKVMNSITSNTISLRVAGEHKGAYQFQVLNTSGQIIIRGKFTVDQPGLVDLRLQSSLSAGVYILHIQGSKIKLNHKFFIK